MSEFLQLGANGVVSGSIIALAAVGISLVYGILRIVNFAQGDYLTFGAYVAVGATLWSIEMTLAVLLAVIATALLATALELVLWRPLRRRRAGFMSLFLVSIGLALVLRNLIFLVAGGTPRSYPVDPFRAYDIGPIRLSGTQLAAVAVALAAVVAVAALLRWSTVGKTMRALSDDSLLASISGIAVNRVIVLTWALAGGLAGLSGVLGALVQTSFDPNFGFALLLPAFAAVVLGGIGSAYGALLGGLALGLLTELATWPELAGGVDPVYKPVVAFVVLVVVLLIRPQGLLGRARVL